MKQTIRTFIAIKIKPEKKLSEIIERCRKALPEEKIRWVDSDNLHVTLRFLGETTKEQANEVIDFLESLPKDFPGFQIELKGIGYFKRKKQAKVLFIKTENDFQLKQLAKAIETKMIVLGFKTGDYEFTPHLTLARFKYIIDKEKFYYLTEKYSGSEIQQVNVSEIIFYQSILSSEGPTYKPIKIIKLN